VLEENVARIDAHIASHRSMPGALMPLLHAIQDDLGYVPEGSYPSIAKALNLSVAEVHGVVTFYHHFRTHAPGRHVLQICRAESCQAMGSEALEAHVNCLGNCACSPSVMIDEQVCGRVDADRINQIIAEAKGA
jgi:formate dehydrogenase subunit gamma